MLWLGRPPYLRWVAAVAVVAAAAAMDLRGRREVPVPYAATTIERGDPIAPRVVVWRPAAVGSVPVPEDLDGAVAAVRIERGDPIVASVVSRDRPIPEGWWSVPVALGPGATKGDAVRLVLVDGDRIVPGVVVEEGEADVLTAASVGSVAVPEVDATDVAVAAAEGRLVVLVAP